MTESSTTVRLSKAAKEFNVGTATIVEFLSKKGHTIDPNPNTRLSGEMYELVRKEYSQEKKGKKSSRLRLRWGAVTAKQLLLSWLASHLKMRKISTPVT